MGSPDDKRSPMPMGIRNNEKLTNASSTFKVGIFGRVRKGEGRRGRNVNCLENRAKLGSAYTSPLITMATLPFKSEHSSVYILPFGYRRKRKSVCVNVCAHIILRS